MVALESEDSAHKWLVAFRHLTCNKLSVASFPMWVTHRAGSFPSSILVRDWLPRLFPELQFRYAVTHSGVEATLGGL